MARKSAAVPSSVFGGKNSNEKQGSVPNSLSRMRTDPILLRPGPWATTQRQSMFSAQSGSAQSISVSQSSSLVLVQLVSTLPVGQLQVRFEHLRPSPSPVQAL